MEFILLVVTLLLTMLQESAACTCMPAHLQQHYCKSDFIIVATVKHVKETYRRNDLPQSTELDKQDLYNMGRIPTERRFTVRVHRTYKGMTNPNFRNAIKKFIYTSGSGAACGVMLETQKTYILSGSVRDRTLRVNMCNWIQEHKSLQAHQKKFLKFMYRKHCGCNVVTCFGSYCAKEPDQNPKKMCEYSPNWTNDCYQKHGLCVGTGGICHWKKNNKFKICLKSTGEIYPWRLMRKRVEETYVPRRREEDSNTIGFPGFVEP